MNAERGRGPRMPERLREAMWDRVVKVVAVAALGFALSACGGGGSSSASAPTAQSSMSSGSSLATDSPAPDQSTSTDTTTPTGSGSSGTSGSASGTSSGGTSGGSTSGNSGSNPPTASTGNVTINWNPPTQNTDGTPLTNLAGFKIHYGSASQKYTQTITVNNPGLVTYVVANLPAGTYYFAVTAYSATGTESPLSSEVSTKVN
jgi:hypothetical protein